MDIYRSRGHSDLGPQGASRSLTLSNLPPIPEVFWSFQFADLAMIQSEGGFPELKVLKQRVRNILQPEMDLGHSDVKLKSP